MGPSKNKKIKKLNYDTKQLPNESDIHPKQTKNERKVQPAKHLGEVMLLNFKSVSKVLGGKKFYENEFDAFNKYYTAVSSGSTLCSNVTVVDDLDFVAPCELYKMVKTSNLQHKSQNLKAKPLKKVNTKILYASNSVKLRDNPEKGRHLVASVPIQRYETIINEPATVLQVNPSCSCVRNQHLQYRCHYCANLCSDCFICSDCKITLFCSEDCKSKAYYEFHQYECDGFQRHYWPMKETDYSYMAFRMMLYGIHVNFDTDISNSRCYGNRDNNYAFIYQLKSNFNSLPVEKVYEILELSSRTLLYLIYRTRLFSRIEAESHKTYHKYIGGLLVKHYCQAQLNTILLRFPNVNVGFCFNVVGATGKAICPTVALLNHSCSPNAAVIPYGNRIIIKAMRPITTGEEITICYQELSAFSKLQHRDMVTRELFGFTCHCSLCIHERAWINNPYLCEVCKAATARKEILESKILGYCTKCDSYFEFPFNVEGQANISKRIFRKRYKEEQLHYILECYKFLYPSDSFMFLDIWKLLFEKYTRWHENPIMVIKYGFLMFNLMEKYIPRLYKPFMEVKLNFITEVINRPDFIAIKKVSGPEFGLEFKN
ncbi:uncharacterized protein LOC132698389 isoform X2 [Cylas formicarius]|uniref:uncharacterized protein LOC132698389 isoform X2 n=1 Tax=Cylas formicarius TaxID=197179 RepID=UPI002958B284|nr:uncharacterized protein LOC132698389 isoform X2 [Cylas formicarius]